MFNERLKQERNRKGYSGQKMADMLFISLRHYQRYESGENSPTLEGLVKIADILDVSTDYLLCRDEFIERKKAENP